MSLDTPTSSIDRPLHTRKIICGYTLFAIVSFLVSSSHETFVRQRNRWFWGGGYRRIGPVFESTTLHRLVSRRKDSTPIFLFTPLTVSSLQEPDVHMFLLLCCLRPPPVCRCHDADIVWQAVTISRKFDNPSTSFSVSVREYHHICMIYWVGGVARTTNCLISSLTIQTKHLFSVLCVLKG